MEKKLSLSSNFKQPAYPAIINGKIGTSLSSKLPHRNKLNNVATHQLPGLGSQRFVVGIQAMLKLAHNTISLDVDNGRSDASTMRSIAFCMSLMTPSWWQKKRKFQ
eukprot:m.102615 g.102615  ORF g.102615 m.102615 type:complete len:106 (+) comp37180_c0_seq3:905-1222(+)